MDTIFLVSPNTEKDRLKQIIKSTSGFLYMVAVFGTTGVQTKIHKYTLDALMVAKPRHLMYRSKLDGTGPIY